MPIDFSGLDTAIHGPVRLGAMSALMLDGALSFSELKARLQITDGALGLHLRKLEDLSYISAKKTFVGRRPRTTFRLTRKGKNAFASYLSTLRTMLDTLDAHA